MFHLNGFRIGVLGFLDIGFWKNLKGITGDIFHLVCKFLFLGGEVKSAVKDH